MVCGEGDVFCAGLDLADVIPASIEEGSNTYLKPGQCDPFRLYGPPCSKPVIMAVHGRCYTAGLELTLAADMCVAATGYPIRPAGDHARHFSAWRRDHPPADGDRLGRQPCAASWPAAQFSAEDAHRWGLVQVLAEPGDQFERALDLAREVAKCAPLAVQAALASARLAQTDGTRAAVEHIRTEGRRIALSA